MRSNLLYEDHALDFYPGSMHREAIFYSITFPDFPEIGAIKEPTMGEALATAEINLSWAIRRRMENNLLIPWASAPDSIEGEICMIKASPTPPIIQSEE
ncbi:hypothetical protein UFOVP28_68 [uncultured Caudovirales phage]|uniref:Uncharacterized protein n=1 Tax=uncultured Caudovirales phage TaxID=2100421 RepID=A0A6J5KMA2_9CAUD|nr:hypothetical protein UFOVP28_68 [uncultured Caudovirales phage]